MELGGEVPLSLTLPAPARSAPHTEHAQTRTLRTSPRTQGTGRPALAPAGAALQQPASPFPRPQHRSPAAKGSHCAQERLEPPRGVGVSPPRRPPPPSPQLLLANLRHSSPARQPPPPLPRSAPRRREAAGQGPSRGHGAGVGVAGASSVRGAEASVGGPPRRSFFPILPLPVRAQERGAAHLGGPAVGYQPQRRAEGRRDLTRQHRSPLLSGLGKDGHLVTIISSFSAVSQLWGARSSGGEPVIS